MSELPKFVVDHLRNAQPIGEHPDADLLTAFAEQSLGERERTSVLLHLSTCPDCREMTTLVMGREPAEVLVHAATAAHSSSVPPSERIELAAAAGKAYREVTPRSWFRWPSFSSPALRWVAAAACVVVVSAAVLMNKRPAQKQTPGLTSDAITLSDERTPTTSTTPQSPAADRRLREELQEQRESSTFAKRRSAPPLSQPEEQKDREIMGYVRPEPRVASRSAVANGAAQAISPPPTTDADAFRVKVEDSAAQHSLAKGTAVAQEKSVAATVPPANGKDQTGVLVADKLASKEKAAAAPAPTFANRNSSAALASGAKRDDRAESAIGSTSETVEVSGGPLALESAQVEPANRVASPQWNVTANGDVLRSLDAGKNWKTITIDSKAQFVAIATTGASIWAGGKNGVLYHSTDVGEHWTRVTPNDGGNSLSSDISGIEFTDVNHGTVRAGASERWTTTDGGKSWKRE